MTCHQSQLRDGSLPSIEPIVTNRRILNNQYSQSTSGWYAGTPCLTHADVLIAASLEFLIRLDKNGDKIFEGFPLMELQYKKVFTTLLTFCVL